MWAAVLPAAAAEQPCLDAALCAKTRERNVQSGRPGRKEDARMLWIMVLGPRALYLAYSMPSGALWRR